MSNRSRDDSNNVLPIPLLGDWISTVSSIDDFTGDRADVFETVRPDLPNDEASHSSES